MAEYSPAQHAECLPNLVNKPHRIGLDLFDGEAVDCPAETVQFPITRPVRLRHLSEPMMRTIHLDAVQGLWVCEVDFGNRRPTTS